VHGLRSNQSVGLAYKTDSLHYCLHCSGLDFPLYGSKTVPIFPAVRQFEYKGAACTRTQFPLRDDEDGDEERGRREAGEGGGEDNGEYGFPFQRALHNMRCII
jgi:hypothetical protein